MQQIRSNPYKRGRAQDWPKERIEQLDKQGIQQLRDNAERLGETELATLCADVLKARPRVAAAAVAKKPARAMK
jgi:hypothetical protein